MLLDANLVDVSEVTGQDLLRGMSRQHTNEQVDDAFRDDRIAVGAEKQFTVVHLRMEPHLRLATGNQVRIILILRVDEGQALPQLNNIIVFVHPVVEQLKFFNDFAFRFCNAAHSYIL